MRRAPLAFALVLAAYLAVIAGGWLGQPVTGGELAGHAAKIQALLRLLATGDFAWFPAYLGGSPTATTLSFALSVPVYAPALLLLPDPIVAMKLTALLLLAAGGLAAFAFGRRLTGDAWAGFAVGLAYLLSPQLLLRAGWQEHMTILTAVPLVPLAFLALLRVAERGRALDGLLLGAVFSATLLAWAKMGATLALPLTAFALWLFVTRPLARPALLRGLGWAAATTLLLGVLPLLPLLRERAFMTVFALDPFAQWQAAYSARTATAWLDRDGDLFALLPPGLGVARGGYYLGLIGLLALSLFIARTWRDRHAARFTPAIRIFTALALVLYAISFGPRSILQGHFEILAVAQNAPDWLIPLHWLALAALGAVLYWLLPAHRSRPALFAGLLALLLFAPLFRLLEALPLFGDLRAPDSFWILNGTFCAAVAAGLAVVALLRDLAPRRLAPALAALVGLLAALDFSPYFAPFFRGGIDAPQRAAYAALAAPLRAAEGRVLFVTGRYFPLDLPQRTGRPLATEALNRYLTPAPTIRLQVAGQNSATDMLTALELAGIGDIVIDRLDRDTSPRLAEWFRAMLPVRLENDAFLVLQNPDPLFPAFFANAAIPARPGPDEYLHVLAAAKRNLLTIAPGPGQPPPDLPATIPAEPPPAFSRVPLTAATPSRSDLTAPGRAGWIVLSQGWHPDWTATVDGRPVPVFRAAGAFPAVPVTAASRAVTFRFQPPAWYAATLGLSGLGWLLIGGLLILRPARLRRPPAAPARPAATTAGRTPIQRPLAILPTYNEAESILAIIARILEVHPALHVLVVDDASPDGTAALVERLAATEPRVHLLARPGKLGLGSAYRAGFAWARTRDHDACLEIDADFSHDPADIPRLLAALDAGADAAIGSRYLDGIRVLNWPEHRLLLSAGATRYVRWLTGLPLTDATSGFKALRLSALATLDDRDFRAEGYGFQIELHWLLWRAGFRLTEVPIVFTERRLGQTKMTTGIALEAALRVLQLALRNPSRHPLPA